MGTWTTLISNAAPLPKRGVRYSEQDCVIRFWNAGCKRIFIFLQEAIGRSTSSFQTPCEPGNGRA
jgi:hypothetical protein